MSEENLYNQPEGDYSAPEPNEEQNYYEQPVNEQEQIDYYADPTPESGSYHQPEYNYSYANGYQQGVQEEKGMSIGSLVLGIVSILFSCIPIMGFVLGIVGIVLGAVGQKKGAKGIGVAGMVCSIIGLVSAILWFVFTLIVIVSSAEFMSLM